MVIPFYIYVLLGILVRSTVRVRVYILYNYLFETIGDCNEFDSDSDTESDTETITDAVMERERKQELKNTIDDAENNLKEVEKALELDKNLPVNRKHNNRHLNHIKEEFSSYLDKKAGSDITQSLEEIEAVLKEEIDYLKNDIYGYQVDKDTDQPDRPDKRDKAENNYKTDKPENEDKINKPVKSYERTDKYDKSEENTNQPEEKKDLDPFFIEEEIPSFLDDLD